MLGEGGREGRREGEGRTGPVRKRSGKRGKFGRVAQAPSRKQLYPQWSGRSQEAMGAV